MFSFVASFFWARFRHFSLAIFSALIFPFFASWGVYWLPLMDTSNTSEQSNWFWFIVFMWLMFALPISLAVTFLVRRSRAQENA